MILSELDMFCEKRAIASGTTDIIDLKKGGDALVHELTVVATCPETAVGGTSLTFEVETADDEAFGSTRKTLFVSPPVPVADMKAGGKVLVTRMPRGAKRYVRVKLTAAGSFSAGTVSVFMVTGDQHNWKEIGK